ncbi:hypothetical protein JWG44_12670 [Leptospira sp. 201903071]|uniref:hypothetical protein n=1 Tax=Leptospira ainazelensis TaxID=2810034 RepID=UPI0019622C69|nr:hypothetical protein [Leptospira ainazelensis]MBM9501106.1 hypothetical protein [Leptospira ainazelensis]
MNLSKKITFYWILLWSPFLCMSQIHYQQITLEELVRSSPYIFLVRAADPSFSVTKIKIHSKLLKELGIQEKLKKKVPDFERRIAHYEVQEVLKGSWDQKTISVLPANFVNSLELHILYYGTGLSISPIYLSYNPPQEVNEENQDFIIFLRRSSRFETFEWNTVGSIESIGRKEEILDLIRNR